MKVKKINPEWKPSENPELEVGETIDLTDPKQLILNGDVVAIGATGEEISAYELYGVIVQNERKEFEEYLKVKKQESLKAQLEKEEAELKAQYEKLKEEKEVEAKTEVKEEVKEPVKAAPVKSTAKKK